MRLPVRCLLILILVSPAMAAGQTVRGRVLDALTRSPIYAAEVRLLQGERVISAATTDSLGRFALSGPEPGRYRLLATRIGYGELAGNPFSLAAETVVNTELLLAAQAVNLAPLTLTAPRDRYLESKGFYERRQSGNGDYLTGDEVRKRNTFFLADLLRGMRGIQIQRVNARNEVYFSGANCLPMIILDGVTVRWGGKIVGTSQPLEDLVPVTHIDGIEAYRGGSGVPTEYVGPNAGCGVILIWTRHK